MTKLFYAWLKPFLFNNARFVFAEYSQLHKRRTLQKEDVKEAIQKTDIFDFLVDVIQ